MGRVLHESERFSTSTEPPAARKALNDEAVDALTRYMELADRDSAVRAFVLSGDASVFCPVEIWESFSRMCRHTGFVLFSTIGRVRFSQQHVGYNPVIAVLNGPVRRRSGSQGNNSP